MQAERSTNNGQEVRLAIPSVEPGVNLVAILHHVNPDRRPTTDLCLLLHGIMSHKNMSYHRELANALPMDSLRFDFRGSGESDGEWGSLRVGRDLQDIQAVVEYCTRRLRYTLELVVAHSRGSLDAWTYFARDERLRWQDGQADVPFFVAVSGRWEMRGALDRYTGVHEAYAKGQTCAITIRYLGRERTFTVSPSEYEAVRGFPIAKVVQRAPRSTDVCIVHGTADKAVPSSEAERFNEELRLNARRPSDAQQVRLIEGADHMFKGFTKPVTETIVAWYKERKAAQQLRETKSHL